MRYGEAKGKPQYGLRDAGGTEMLHVGQGGSNYDWGCGQKLATQKYDGLRAGRSYIPFLLFKLNGNDLPKR
jgi:hypothetical protein